MNKREFDISSLKNEKIKNYVKLHKKKYRTSMGKFIIEGEHLVEEAKNAGVLNEVISSKEDTNGIYVPQFVIDKLSTTVAPQSIIGICNLIKHNDELGNKVLVLDNVQDPGNVGTLIRTSVAFGYNSIIINGVDVFNEKVIRSSQGALFKINIVQSKELSEIRDNDYLKIGAVVNKDAEKYTSIKIPEKFMLILGNEGNGISKETLKHIDKFTYIPIKFESLNVAIAGGILMSKFN